MFDSVLRENLYKEDKDWVLEFKKKRYELFKELPIPSWKRVGLSNFSFPQFKEYSKNVLNGGHKAINLVSLKGITNGLMEEEKIRDIVEGTMFKGVDEKLVAMVEGSYNTGVYINIPKGAKSKEPILIEYKLDKKDNLVIDFNVISLEEDSEGTIVIDYSSNGVEEGFHNGVTKVFLKKNATANIIKIQRLNDSSANFNSDIAYVEGNGKVNWTIIELGSKISASSYTTILKGEGSEGNIRSIYLGDGSRKLDIEYSMVHRGMRSISSIESRGVLKDNSRKVFRGNLEFKRGSKKSKGIEEEYVILLDPTVKAHSIPALFSQEDDVEGQHGASAGQINSNRLFYLMSRGLSEKEAKKLVIESSFKPILEKIPIENLKGKIIEEIDRRVLYV